MLKLGFADCWSCSIVASQVQGGRPKKRKRVVRNEKSPEKKEKKIDTDNKELNVSQRNLCAKINGFRSFFALETRDACQMR